jgi:hypothetical protein
MRLSKSYYRISQNEQVCYDSFVKLIARTEPLLGAPGIYYPASIVQGFDPKDFSSPSRIHATQLAIFNSDGSPVLPSDVPYVLTPGTVIGIRLCFDAWKFSYGDTMVRFLLLLYFDFI